MRKNLLTAVIFTCFTSSCVLASVKPRDFGLLTAKNGEERYFALYNAHKEANRLGTTVDYSGIDSLALDIPRNAEPILIKGSQDFKGVVFYVKNTVRDHYLFVCKNKSKSIEVPQNIIDGGDFRSIKELKSGVKLLLLKDDKLWVENRSGYNYGATRRDVVLLINGIAQNKTVMPYGNVGISHPDCSYAETDTQRKIIKNLVFVRAADSKYMTFLIQAANINNIEFRNIKCFTPEVRSMYGDRIFAVGNCTNVTYRDIKIEGMYTQDDKYGYGISQDNLWNVKFFNVNGNVKQGIICNSNINQSYLKNCKMNRYDIHCYGRDAVMEDCTFKGMYFPVASFYGKIVFKRCSFINSQPVWLRADYNAYVPFDIVLYNCSWYPIKGGRDSICYTGELNKAINSRDELSEKCWPSIKIRGLKVYPPDDFETLYVFRVGGGDDLCQPISYMPFIDIKGLKVYGSDIKLDICNKKIRLLNSPKVKVKQARGSSAIVRLDSIKE